jgi:predicted DsbA family dithiol-disulfide isomerase
VVVRHRHFPLHPGLPDEGVILADLLRGKGFDLSAAMRRLAEVCAAEGLPWSPGERSYPTRRAQELAVVAEREGVSLHAALFRAYFVEQRRFSDPEVLTRVAVEAGLAEDVARRALATREGAAEVDRDAARARALGITGVPTYVCAGRGVVGAQPEAALERLLSLA